MKKKVVLSFFLVFCILVVSLLPGNYIRVEACKESTLTDFHMHMQSKELADAVIQLMGTDKLFDTTICEMNAGTIISHINRTGFKKALVLSGAYIWGIGSLAEPQYEYDKVKAENDWTAAQAAEYPDRLIPLFSVNPLKDYALEEMDRCFDQLKMPAMKLHFSASNVDLKNPDHLKKVEKVLAHAEYKGIPVLVHLYNSNLKFGPEHARVFIDDILANHPGLRICIAHLGGPGGYDDNTGDIFDTFIKAYKHNKKLKKENLYFDISSVIIDRHIEGYYDITTKSQLRRITRQIRTWGPDRILWGSDYPTATTRSYIITTFKKLRLNPEGFYKLMFKDVDQFLSINVYHETYRK